jgi:hypothetical protein
MDNLRRVELMLKEKLRLQKAIEDLEALRVEASPDRRERLDEIERTLRAALEEARQVAGIEG